MRLSETKMQDKHSNVYCIYLRKSRADAELEAQGQGDTLARHKRTLLALAERLGLTIGAVYEEVVSGETIAARPEVQRMLSDIEKGMWAGVLVMEVERLARGDTIDQGVIAQTFKYSNTKIVTPQKIYDPGNLMDEEFFEFGLFMSRREYRAINRRLQMGRATSQKEGKFIGSVAPYGYRRKKLEKQKGYTLEIDEAEAPAVRMIFDWYTAASDWCGVSLIANQLNQLHIPTRSGSKWTTTRIIEILRNPVYNGKIRANYRTVKKHMNKGQIRQSRERDAAATVYDGLHPAIVNDKQFALAQERLSSHKGMPVRHTDRVSNPLAGLVVCGECGHKMKRRPLQGGKEVLICDYPQCRTVSSPLSVVEDELLDALYAWAIAYQTSGEQADFHRGEQRREQAAQIECANLQNELNTLQKQLDRTHDLLEQGVYSLETFLARSQTLSASLAAKKKGLEQAEKNLAHIRLQRQESEALLPAVQNILANYRNTADTSVRNRMLKEVLDTIVYNKHTGLRWANQSDLSLSLVMRVPTCGVKH